MLLMLLCNTATKQRPPVKYPDSRRFLGIQGHIKDMSGLIKKHRDAIVAVGITALVVPIMYQFNSRTLMATQLVAIGIQLGTQFWVSTVAGPTMRANLEKETFAGIQSILFPRYGLLNTCTSFISLLSYMKLNPGAGLLQIWSPGLDLVASLAMNVLNTVVLFPWTLVVLKELYASRKTKDEKRIAAASKNFGLVHGSSTLVNYATMAVNVLFIHASSHRLV